MTVLAGAVGDTIARPALVDVDGTGARIAQQGSYPSRDPGTGSPAAGFSRRSGTRAACPSWSDGPRST